VKVDVCNFLFSESLSPSYTLRAHSSELNFCRPQPKIRWRYETTDTGRTIHGMPFTPQLSLILVDWPQRDGRLSWRWYTAAMG